LVFTIMSKKNTNSLLNRLIIILSTPLIVINVFCAVLVKIKNWSMINTKELDV